MGAGCDGVVPTDGRPPKIIDACGVCGGDESECATGRSARTAHAVGDPHYLTFDGTSFDYQIAGEFILARHMNDIEMQNATTIANITPTGQFDGINLKPEAALEGVTFDVLEKFLYAVDSSENFALAPAVKIDEGGKINLGGVVVHVKKEFYIDKKGTWPSA